MSSEARQRKIDPIYDAIDSQNYKGAIKLCLKKDIQNWDITKSLLAYSYACLNRNEEAFDLAREVKSKIPTDESVLSALSLTFKLLGADNEALSCYENALLQQPENENMGSEVFFCYVKIRDFKKQNQLALRMFKQFNKPRYVYWAVTSLLQQPDIQSNTISLSLGEKMLRKILYEGSGSQTRPGSEEIQLFIQVLKYQKKFDQAFESLEDLLGRQLSSLIEDEQNFASSPDMVKPNDLQITAIKSELLEKLQDWERLRSVLLAQVHTHPDQWDAHKLLVRVLLMTWNSLKWKSDDEDIDAGIGVGLGNRSNSDEKAASSGIITEHQQRVLQLQMAHQQVRGPRLAEIHLLVEWARVAASDDSTASTIPTGWQLCGALEGADGSIETAEAGLVSTQLMRLLQRYLDTFSDRLCCTADLAPYLRFLIEAQPSARVALRGWVEEKMRTIADGWALKHSQGDDQHRLESDVCRYTKYRQILNILSEDLEDALARISASQTEILAVDRVGGSADSGAGATRDELLVLLASTPFLRPKFLVSSLNKSHPDEGLHDWLGCLQSAALLEYGVATRPLSPVLSVAILEPLRGLGAGEAAVKYFNKLGVKFIQTDSMTFTVFPAMLEAGLISEASRALRAVMLFHANAGKDTSDMVVKAYKYSNYTKVFELLKFTDRCKSSMQLALSKAEYPLIHICEAIHSPAAAATYLKECASGSRLEALDPAIWKSIVTTSIEGEPLLGHRQQDVLSGLSDNMDYSLLPSTWVPLASDAEHQKSVRHSQYSLRIRRGRLLQRILHAFLPCGIDAEPTITRAELTALLDGLREIMVPSLKPPQSPLRKESWMYWSQDISYGADFEQLLGRAICSFLDLMSAYHINLRYKQAVGDEEGSFETHTQSRLEVLTSDFHHLSDWLLGAQDSSSVGHRRYLPPTPVSEASNQLTPLRPDWLRASSGFLVTLGSWGPLIGCELLSLVVPKAEGNKKKKGRGKGDNSSQAGSNPEVFTNLVTALSSLQRLMENLHKVLSEEVVHSKDGQSVLDFASGWISFIEPGQNLCLNDPEVTRSLRRICEELSSSQRLSCERLRDGLQEKLALLRKELSPKA